MNFDWDDILILGDSFAACRTETTDWPRTLAVKLTGDEDHRILPRGAGYPGGAWWSVRNRLIKELAIQVPKVLVVCHTEPGRLHSDDDYSLNYGSLTGVHRKYLPISNSIIDAACLYYEHLISDNYITWANAQWFKELDSLIHDYNIPVVLHLDCFEFTQCDAHKEGISFKETLFSIQLIDAGGKLDTSREAIKFRNHFLPGTNVALANTLYDAIMNYRPEQNGTVQNLNLLG